MVLAGISMILTEMSFLKRSIPFLLLPLAITMQCSKAGKTPDQPGTATIKDSVIADGLSYPWEILWGPDDHIWMTERGGRISRLNPSTGTLVPLHTITEVVASGEGGLLGLSLHPQFAATPHVYVAYNYNHPDGYREKLVRYTYTGTGLENPLLLFDNIAAAGIHNGSRLLVVGDKLFMTTGDANNTTRPQDITSPNGKILRLNLDGSIPADNPVAGNPYWSYGHRNAQGLVFANNILYSSEHGPSSDDEINIIVKGGNYGWPHVRGYCNESGEQNFCNNHEVKEPIIAWTPTIAACGLDFYNHDLIPQWKNSLLLATLKDARIYQLKLDGNHTAITESKEYFRNDYGRIRDICISPQGKVYFCTSNGQDVIVELRGEE